MPGMSDIRHSIRSISDMEQITRAMHLISTSKMRKAIAKYETNHTHFVRVRTTIKDILAHTHELKHPYIGESEGGKASYVVIAADKGLCGGYNHNVLNLAFSAMQKKRRPLYPHGGAGSARFFSNGRGSRSTSNSCMWRRTLRFTTRGASRKICWSCLTMAL